MLRRMAAATTRVGSLGAAWGVLGVVLLLGNAIRRLAPIAVRALVGPLGWREWAALALWVGVMGWFEGYKGSKRGFSPRVAARARWLAAHPTGGRTLLAPLFCMGYFHASRRRQVTSIAVAVGIVLLIVGVRHVAQPWRGIIDVGVIVGLAWGLVALLAFTARAFGARGLDCSPDLPVEGVAGRSAAD